MEVHQSCFVDATTFATEFSASRADFAVMRPECVAALPETLVPRSDFVASTADVRQFAIGQDCASQMNSDGDFVYAVPLKVRRPRAVAVVPSESSCAVCLVVEFHHSGCRPRKITARHDAVERRLPEILRGSLSSCLHEK